MKNKSVVDIYMNCLQHMKNTETDWEKTLSFLSRRWSDKTGADILECIFLLEQQIGGYYLEKSSPGKL